MNKISKDIIVRSKSMSGFYAPYIPGWDTHGLPIEQVLAKQGVKRKEMDLERTMISLEILFMACPTWMFPLAYGGPS